MFAKIINFLNEIIKEREKWLTNNNVPNFASKLKT